MSIKYPNTRLRRLRSSKWIRTLNREVTLKASDLILPLFIRDTDIEANIKSLPTIKRLNIAEAVEQAKLAYKENIQAIMLFPVINLDKKDEIGSEAYNSNNIICKAIKAIKDNTPEIGIICDIALDPFTNHGQDGILNNDVEIDNDATLNYLSKQSLVLAQAGADVLAPSDMMDGRIGKIRHQLELHGHYDMIIISYSNKYASSFYGPFREAVLSKSLLKTSKETYQMSFHNSREAINEALLDYHEGADILMIKPSSFYLDIISKIKDEIALPIYGYQVSGEFLMIYLLSKELETPLEQLMYENLVCIKRAGCQSIVSYYALEMAKYLNNS